jgi:hypothetical protein
MGPQNEAEEERLRKAKRVKQVLFWVGVCDDFAFLIYK